MTTHDRYHRQRLVEGFGDCGQDALRDSCVAIVGIGALGCLSASFLARSGIGRLILIDRDIVEKTNLQRQLLFNEVDAATQMPKAIAAKQHLESINSEIVIDAHVEDLEASNIKRLLKHADVIVDGLDNFQTRYLLNDFAIQEQIPFMFAGVIAGQGNVMTIIPKKPATPCLRCLFPEPPKDSSQETCDTAGVLAPAIGIASSCQTMDVLKYLTGNRDRIPSSLLTFDLWNTDSNRLSLGEPGEGCSCCQKHEFEFLCDTSPKQAESLCGQMAVQIPSSGLLDLKNVCEKLTEHGSFQASEFVLRGALREEVDPSGNHLQLTCFQDGRILVHGTDDVKRAKAICSRYVGI